MKFFLNCLKSIGLLVIITGFLSSCAANDFRLNLNTGDLIAERLHVGMTNNEVNAAIADLKQYVWEDDTKTVESEQHLYTLYNDNYYPKDVLKDVNVGTPFRVLVYWTNYAGRDAGTLRLFFDQGTHRLRGWVNTPSPLMQDRFMHERLTSQLKWSEGGEGGGMTHAQVHALLGEPDEIISPPQHSRAIYEDHFWDSPPAFIRNQKIEVYSYALDNGVRRHVYLLYYPVKDELIGWGYDHAWEEAERYQREKETTKK